MPQIGPTLDMMTTLISANELDKATRKLALNKAMGADRIPAELWKAIVQSKGVMESMLSFCNECWLQK